MVSNVKPYGDINLFPAFSPMTTMLLAYTVEFMFGKQLPEAVHEAIVAVATIFTYGLIPISLISYATFKYFILPALNYLPSKIRINAYLLNVIIILILTEIIFVVMIVWFQGFDKLTFKFTVAAIPTSYIALNCFGHIYINKFQSKMKQAP